MGFKEVIAKAKERYEGIQRQMDEKRTAKRDAEVKKLKAETQYYQVKAKHQRSVNKYEKLKGENERLKQSGMARRGDKIKKSMERFNF